jgi:predicted nucleic acid-binding Zn ribbon protein
MALQSLHQALGFLEHHEGWQARQRFQHLLAHWNDVVGPVVAAQTRPTGIQRSVLRVATSSAAWAQNLTFERQRILNKLNPRLAEPLVNIRFSTAQWDEYRNDAASLPEAQQLWQQHPSRLTSSHPSESARSPQPTDLQVAFQHWANTIQARSQALPLCPQCQCPTPPGELNRWSSCSLCAAKQW